MELEQRLNELNLIEEIQVNEFDDFMNDLELDFSYQYDVNLSALLDNLEYNDFDDNQIIEMAKNRYGNCMDFYKVIDSNLEITFVLGVGQR